MYEIYVDGYLILTIHGRYGDGDARKILLIMQMFGRPGASLWKDGICIADEAREVQSKTRIRRIA